MGLLGLQYIESTKSIISYRILVAKRCEGGSARMHVDFTICHNVRYVSRGLSGAHAL